MINADDPFIDRKGNLVKMLDDLDRLKALFRAMGIGVLAGKVSVNPPPMFCVELLMTEEQCSAIDAMLTEMLARRGLLDEAGNPKKGSVGENSK